MKSILVIGMGRFGRHLASQLQSLGNEIMVVDSNPAIIDSLSEEFVDMHIGDCTNEGVLRALGVSGFDLCFVTIGEDFQSSLVITSLLKKLDAKCVIAKANQSIQAELLKKIGADEVVYPEREYAERLAIRYNAKNIFDYVQLTSEYSIYELPILPDWVGHTVSEINVRRKYRVNIIAIKNGTRLSPMPGPDYVFCSDDHLCVIGKAADVFKLSART